MLCFLCDVYPQGMTGCQILSGMARIIKMKMPAIAKTFYEALIEVGLMK